MGSYLFNVFAFIPCNPLQRHVPYAMAPTFMCISHCCEPRSKQLVASKAANMSFIYHQYTDPNYALEEPEVFKSRVHAIYAAAREDDDHYQQQTEKNFGVWALPIELHGQDHWWQAIAKPIVLHILCVFVFFCCFFK